MRECNWPNLFLEPGCEILFWGPAWICVRDTATVSRRDGKGDSDNTTVQFSSVQFSCSVVSDSLRPHESQHTRPPCPSPSPGVHSDSCPSSPWCHPAIPSSVVPFNRQVKIHCYLGPQLGSFLGHKYRHMHPHFSRFRAPGKFHNDWSSSSTLPD